MEYLLFAQILKPAKLEVNKLVYMPKNINFLLLLLLLLPDVQQHPGQHVEQGDEDVDGGELLELSTAYACQGDLLELACPSAGQLIRVKRANFGRFSIAVCNEENRTNLSVNCVTRNTLPVMTERFVYLRTTRLDFSD